MRYNSIRRMDISNGPGCRVSVFVQGCYIKCKGCFNKELWDYQGGKEWTKETTEFLLTLLNNKYINGITWLGGEPTLYPKEITLINKLIKEKYPDKTIWLYTGLEEKYINFSNTNLIDLFKSCDTIVAGPYIEELRDINLKFMGSSNQKIINLKQ